ncbi:MAG: FHA domain-containing protein [Verrucomicrobiota bacterium]|jgi:pSer/pThr/pTyr-binding forkhead associated (FHA) protein
MVLFRILSGKLAGTEIVACHFPFRVGRAPTADLRLEARGVWDQHCELLKEVPRGIVLQANHASLTLLNGERVEEATLRNGDLLELGEVRLQFWLSPAVQTGLAAREILTWLTLAGLLFAQIGLIYWLTH